MDTLSIGYGYDNFLQRALSGQSQFSMAPAIAFVDAEDDGFRPSLTASLTTHSLRLEVGFVDFDVACEGAMELASVDQPGSDSLVDCVE